MGSIFEDAKSQREIDQEKQLKEALDQANSKLHRIRVNFSILEESKEKMFKEAEKMGISASALLQLWISEHCD